MRKIIGRLFLWMVGWRVGSGKPPFSKLVLVAAPHTSNWDLPIMLGISYVLGVRVQWIGKLSLFRFPYGWFMRLVGGIAIDRSTRQNLVAQMAEVFRQKDRLILAVPVEGTRGRAEHWKSGFYHIARGAGVPICLGFLDYATKRGGFGPVFEATGDIRADMDKIREFYKGITGKFPEKFTPVRLKEEGET